MKSWATSPIPCPKPWRWLERYLTEGSPRLQHFAEVAADLAKRERSEAEP